jgi:hypothetical protein
MATKHEYHVNAYHGAILSLLAWMEFDFFEASWRSGGVILDGRIYGFERRLTKYTVGSSFKTILTPH